MADLINFSASDPAAPGGSQNVTWQGDVVTGNISAYVPIPAVSSVAGRTGDVVLSAADVSGLAAVATSGAYADLTGAPTIPSAQVNSDWTAVSGVAQILHKPTLATVATSGAYADLTGTPTIGTLGGASLTGVNTFTNTNTFSGTTSLTGATVTVGQTSGTGSPTVNIGTGANNNPTINIGTGVGSGAQTINLATGASPTLNIGNIGSAIVGIQGASFTCSATTSLFPALVTMAGEVQINGIPCIAMNNGSVNFQSSNYPYVPLGVSEFRLTTTSGANTNGSQDFLNFQYNSQNSTTGAATWVDYLKVTALTGALTISKAATFSAAVTHSSTTALNGVTTLGAGLNLNSQTISGTATFSGALTATGGVSVNVLGYGVQFLRPASYANNGASWGWSVLNAANSNNLALGNTGTTYTTGGSFPWLGNSMSFLYCPDELRVGAGTGGNPFPALVLKTTGNLVINTTTDLGSGNKLQVNGGVSITPLATPSTPVITNGGAAGSTAYSYTVTAVDAGGFSTLASVAGSTATGNATLDGTNYNTITWTAVVGAASYHVYRTVGGATQGRIVVSTTALTANDTGLVASGVSTTANQTNPFLAGTPSTFSGTLSNTVFQASSDAPLRLRNLDTTANNWTGIAFQNGAGPIASAAAIAVQNIDHTNFYGHLTFHTRSSLNPNSMVEKVRITSAGSVLIGTTTDSGTARLQVLGPVSVAQLAAPSAPTITQNGAAGGTAYSYAVVAVDVGGNRTTASSNGSTATGNATLDATNNNKITWTAVTGAVSYDVYRISGGATQGKISTATTLVTLNDTGLVASGSAPAYNATSQNVFGGPIYSNGSQVSTTFQAASDGPFRIRNLDLTTNNWAGLSFLNGGGAVSSAIAVQNIDHSNNYAHIAFFTRSAGGFSEKMRVASGGNVLIGTTTDNGTEKLQVAGSALLLAGTRGLQVATTDWSVGGGTGTSINFSPGAATGNTYGNIACLKLGGGGYAPIAIAAGVGSNVLVGTTTDSGTAKLQVNGPVTVAQLAAPAAPVITNAGATGAVAYSYAVAAVDVAGNRTLASSNGSTATGNATLDGTNYNTITWTAVTGAVSYDVYRTVGGAAQGRIVTATAALTANDTGLVASGGVAGYNQTNPLTVGARLLFSAGPTFRATAANLLVNPSGAGSVLLNYDAGTGGTSFCDGAGAVKATVDSAGNGSFVGGMFTGALKTTLAAPATSSSTGVTGTITWDSGFIYICTATNTWKRVAIATF